MTQMGQIEASGWITVAKLSAIRSFYGAESSSEQGIYSQINQLKAKTKTPTDVGFEFDKIGSAVMVRIVDLDLLDFSEKLNKCVQKSKPK